MGRTFENRKNAMAKRGARDSRAFARAGRQIALAVRAGGPSPEGNASLRRAIANARAVSMPKDKIQNAIDKASGANSKEDWQEVLYEGYGPHGVAFLVETTTDNPTRTVSNVRAHFGKCGGNLGNSGSVAFMFDKVGVFVIKPEGLDRDEAELTLIDFGLETLATGEGEGGEMVWILHCTYESIGAMQEGLEGMGVELVSSDLQWIPKTTTAITPEQAEDIETLYDRLEEDEDVQAVFVNAASSD